MNQRALKTLDYTNKKFLLFTILAFAGLFSLKSSAQSSTIVESELKWKIAPEEIKLGVTSISRLTFEGADHSPVYNQNPVVKVVNRRDDIVSVKLKKCKYRQLTALELSFLDTNVIGYIPKIQLDKGKERGNTHTIINILPFRRTSSGFEKMEVYNFELILAEPSKPNNNTRVKSNQSNVFASTSVLASGSWFKLAVTNSGIYKIDHSFLRNTLGLNPEGINPKNIRVFGYGGAALPQANRQLISPDLPEMSVFVSGEQDGQFNTNDFLLFYAQGPRQVFFDSTAGAGRLSHRINIYADTAYYLLQIGNTTGKRINQGTGAANPQLTLTEFDDYFFHENERVNLLKSGRTFYGETFDFQSSYDFNFSVPGIIGGSDVVLNTSTLATGFRASHTSVFTFLVNGNQVGQINHAHPAPGSYQRLGNNATGRFVFNAPNSENLSVGIRYNKNGFNEAMGYLNHFGLQLKRQNRLYGNQTTVRSLAARNVSSLAFNFQGLPAGARAWDISKLNDIQEITLENGTLSDQNNRAVKDYHLFNGTDFPAPSFVGRQENLDLLALQPTELLIITHPSLVAEANRLAEFRRNNDGISTTVVTTTQVYAQFSAGRQDISAIRNMARSMYLKSQQPILKYVLLFGDCSYDYKNYFGLSSLVPIYQSENSVDPIDSYSSDDYFGFMDENEGAWGPFDTDRLDVGIGRIVANNPSEAKAVVDKLISYATNPASFRNWRNRVSFVADNGDFFTHLNDAETVSNNFESRFPRFLVNKIYVAANPTQPSPLGIISPATRASINRSVNEGTLLLNYAGHGNEFQWASEQILTLEDIRSWRNRNNLPLFITATCDFGRYDDPARESGGELILRTPEFGGCGVLTTGRPVFSSNNVALNNEFIRSAFTRSLEGGYPRLGDALRICKNNSIRTPEAGNRGFALLGDPSMKLAYPELDIQLTKFNGRTIDITKRDTLSALQEITLEGEIRNFDGSRRPDFNGRVQVAIYDKPVPLVVREESATRTINVRTNILFNGTASVREGKFTIAFRVSGDINYAFGLGRVNMYALDATQLIDANGFSNNFIVGGSVEDGLPIDTVGPIISLYLNDQTFRDGGLTNEEPTLLARLEDESGINLSTAGIGREITVVLDNNPASLQVVNEYYTTDEDNYKKGWVTYPMSKLTEGEHTLTFTAWDNFNNSSTATLRFRVGNPEVISLNAFSNSPNPLTNFTKFTASHNRPNQPALVELDVYDMMGRKLLNKKINYQEAPALIGGNDELVWRPADSGGKIPQGSYIARITISAEGAKPASATLKLIVID